MDILRGYFFSISGQAILRALEQSMKIKLPDDAVLLKVVSSPFSGNVFDFVVSTKEGYEVAEGANFPRAKEGQINETIKNQ